MTNMRLSRGGVALQAAAAAAAAQLCSTAHAAPGYALPGQIGFQTAVTPIAIEMRRFHNALLLPIITVVSLFVLALLVYCIWKFRETSNPNPSRTTHHTVLEVAWTVVPVMILVVIAIPSFRLLTHQLVIPNADVTIKATGKQWYWSYDYPKDQAGGFGFDSLLKPDDQLKPDQGDLRLLSVDNEAVVPVGKIVRVQVTAADVIHSFAVQSLGIRMDAVPGRLNETWFQADREGLYYGQCSKLCGKDHAFMPIALRVVSAEKYATWLEEAKKKFASTGAPAVAARDSTLVLN